MQTFTVESKDSRTNARKGLLTVRNRSVATPELAIVATKGEFKSIPKEYWEELPVQYLIVNTFHIFTYKTLLDKIKKENGIHHSMGLEKNVIASDSGGFQVFSLGFGQKHEIGKVGRNQFKSNNLQDDESPLHISEDGVEFVYDGESVVLTPEVSMDIQHDIDADIMFAFDECNSPYNSKEYTTQAMKRTHRWLDRCIVSHRLSKRSQLLFGIVQGGEYKDLRELSAKHVGSKDVAGFGIGGSLGSFKEDVYAVLDWTIPYLPDEKPRHFLGIGQVRDIFEGVERGVDLFDCVIPTREARHRVLYTFDKGKVSIRKLKHRSEVFDTTCSCSACSQRVTYHQIWNWFLEKDPRAPMFASIHNIWFYATLTRKIRESIEQDSFLELKHSVLRMYG